MAWRFFNKLENGIVKVAKGISKVLTQVAVVILPVAKEVVPTIVETAGNAFKPGLGTIAKIGVTGLMNELDNLVSGSEQQKQVTYGDSGGVQGFAPKGLHVIDGKLPSFAMRGIGEGFVPHAKGFIGKRPRNAF